MSHPGEWSGRGSDKLRREKEEAWGTQHPWKDREASPVGNGEGHEGGMAECLQDEGLQIGQLESVREPGLSCFANHCVCRPEKNRQGFGAALAASCLLCLLFY